MRLASEAGNQKEPLRGDFDRSQRRSMIGDLPRCTSSIACAALLLISRPARGRDGKFISPQNIPDLFHIRFLIPVTHLPGFDRGEQTPRRTGTRAPSRGNEALERDPSDKTRQDSGSGVPCKTRASAVRPLSRLQSASDGSSGYRTRDPLHRNTEGSDWAGPATRRRSAAQSR